MLHWVRAFSGQIIFPFCFDLRMPTMKTLERWCGSPEYSYVSISFQNTSYLTVSAVFI